MCGLDRDGVFSMTLPRDGQPVAGIDRLQPAQFVDPGRAEPGLLGVDDMAGDHRHGHGAGMPAGRGEAAEMGLGRCLVAQVERLRVVFARELEHFLARHVIMAEQSLGADFQIVEIDHASLIAALARPRKVAK